MKQITNKEYEKYQEYKLKRLNGEILDRAGLRFICEANHNDPAKIGLHLLECLARIEARDVKSVSRP